MFRNSPASLMAVAAAAGIFGPGFGGFGSPLTPFGNVAPINNRGSRRARFRARKERPTWVAAYRNRYESPAMQRGDQRRFRQAEAKARREVRA